MAGRDAADGRDVQEAVDIAVAVVGTESTCLVGMISDH
jgi:hypothetical protein